MESDTVTASLNAEKSDLMGKTRKSSCVNTRGILTVAYQVLHLLPKVGPGLMGGYPRWDTPWQGSPQQGTPLARSDRGYLRLGTPWQGTPSQVWWGYLSWGTPSRVTPQQGYPLAGYPIRSDGAGVPKVGYCPGRGNPLAGVPPCLDLASFHPPTPQVWTERWTDTCQNITFPSYYIRGR